LKTGGRVRAIARDRHHIKQIKGLSEVHCKMWSAMSATSPPGCISDIYQYNADKAGTVNTPREIGRNTCVLPSCSPVRQRASPPVRREMEFHKLFQPLPGVQKQRRRPQPCLRRRLLCRLRHL